MADFANVAELEEFMGSPLLGSRGTAMLGHASATVRLFCHQDLEVVAGRQESYAGDPFRRYIQLTQQPVTAVSVVTIDAVTFTDYTWTRWGLVQKTDLAVWDTGPIVVTYDTGFATNEDEYQGIKRVTLEVAARAMGGNPETFGLEAQELRGPTPALFLTEEEKMLLSDFVGVAVA